MSINETTSATTISTSIPSFQTNRPPVPSTTPPTEAADRLIPIFPVAAILVILIAVFVCVVIVLLIIRKYIKLRKKDVPFTCTLCDGGNGVMCASWTCCEGGITCNSCQEAVEERDCCNYALPNSRDLLNKCCPSKQDCNRYCSLFWTSCFNCHCLQCRCDDCHICPDCSAMECPNFNCCGDCCQCTIKAPECTHITCLCFECGRPPPAP